MTKYEELARKIANSYGFSSDEDGLLASLLERELAPLVEAAQNFLVEIDRKGAAYDPTMRHLREKGLRSALKGWTR